ncbi:MAG: hypothetical protein QGM48_06600 [Actinomycetota bacterium]|nr:hypothetical protein [Actinomycetota bacterium]MDK1026610.1 hypothetical protein [Actinomycetota bacterium]MDK1097515.1 hypothetical protein [Actinomycetota bacterium]
MAVSLIGVETLRPIRVTGHAVKRWSGFVLLAVGAWFVMLALIPGPVLLT